MNLSRWVDTVIEGSNLVYAQPNKGMFTIYFDNSKKRGVGRPIQHCEAEGTLYSSGHVHDFASLQQMIDQLHEWGNCALVWHKEEGRQV